MLDLIYKIFGKNKMGEFKIPERKLNPSYIKNKDYRNTYIRDGYVVIKNVVNHNYIEEVLNVFEEIKLLDGYFESDKLQTTIAFGEEAHKMAINSIKSIGLKIFPQILDSEKCKFDFGGGIIVKNKGCKFAPHQDCSIIDEYKGTTSYAWIPTVTMTNENGTFYAIPGSHIWAAWQRSSQFPKWPLKKFQKLLLEYMIPIQVDKGDILLFDSALIHASGENYSNEIRLAFNAAIIERNAEHVQYVIDNDTPKGKIEKFMVDEEYWTKGDLWGKPKGYKSVLEDTIYPETITKKFLINYINLYSNNNVSTY